MLLSAGSTCQAFISRVSLAAFVPLVGSIQAIVFAVRNTTTHHAGTFKMKRGQSWTQLSVLVCCLLVTLFPTAKQERSTSSLLDLPMSDTLICPPTPRIDQYGHPIQHLKASHHWQFCKDFSKQPQNLTGSTEVYKDRYGLPPPPKFDVWFEYAKARNVFVHDNYDMIYDMMLPFWSLEPTVIRQRVRDVIENEDSFMIVLMLRDGKIAKLEGGLPWQRDAISGMLNDFMQMLPDLDIVFNAHDEPRVVIPHEELIDMVVRGKMAQYQVATLPSLRNEFTRRSHNDNAGSGNGTTSAKFTEYAHRVTHGPAILSCPPDSPARRLVNDTTFDSVAAFDSSTRLSLIKNHTQYTDVCNMPSVQGTHAFFDRPNALSITHNLVPIFSESKISSFQDVVYPSLWHWYGKVFTNNTQDMHLKNRPVYDERLDVDWNNKRDDLYWRGSTTGGYSKDGGWRKHHRQRVVKYLNGFSNATVLAPSQMSVSNADQTLNDSAQMSHWIAQPLSIRHLHAHLNVTFSGVGQCAATDCHAQKEFYQITPYNNGSDAYQHRYVLDMDGNAFSARFYGLMKSKSAVFKQSLFREWHDDWLREWVHYVPLSLSVGVEGRGWSIPESMKKSEKESEWAEVLRWFLDEDGKAAERGVWGPGRKMAERKREWSQRVLRREDMQAWMFRLLLEYARVMDDRRGEIGFDVR